MPSVTTTARESDQNLRQTEEVNSELKRQMRQLKDRVREERLKLENRSFAPRRDD